ncbi:hypothetical protein Sjap_022762 [Stephania japonica]|uniref:Uncharacterized protein n=1 Tax=Stephania japonica TaxID=461633 RepID=A0AAP0ES35_9MAGN
MLLSVVKSTMQSLAGMAIEDVDPSGVMRKARNSLRREVDRSNHLSMTEEEKQRRRSRQRQLYREKKRRMQRVGKDVV